MSNMLDYFLDERLFQSSTLEFRIRADDPKAIHFNEDTMLNQDGFGFYFISDLEKVREDNEAYIHVIAEAHWMKLADRRKPGDLFYEGNTTEWGLTQILDGTGWTIAQVNLSLTPYVMKATDATVLELIWQWARITGNEVTFDILNKTVTMIPQVGADRGLAFRYGRNLKTIKRKSKPPQATRIYPFGAENLNVTSLSGGNSYIEDYSYYTNQGMSLEDARDLYRKDLVLSDDSFVDANGLYSWAQGQLTFMAQPIVTYEMSVLDLSRLTGYNESEFSIGDTVRVTDEVLGIDVRARVSRTVRYPYEPHRNIVELSTSVAIQDPKTSTARADQGKNWELFSSRNVQTPRRARFGHTVLNRIKLNMGENAEWVTGYSLKGVAVGDHHLTVQFKDDVTGLHFWEQLEVDLVDGQVYEYAFTFGQKDVPVGEQVFTVRAWTDSPSAGINIAGGSTALWVLARGSTRENVTLENSIRYEYMQALQKFTVPDDVTEILIEAHGGKGYAANAGNGGMVKGKFAVFGGVRYDILVGGFNFGGANFMGGYPDGGQGGATYGYESTGAGGSSQVRPEGGDLTTALVVAAGGGGGGDGSNPNQQGGYGGFYEGGEPQYGSIADDGLHNHDMRATQDIPGLGGYRACGGR